MFLACVEPTWRHHSDLGILGLTSAMFEEFRYKVRYWTEGRDDLWLDEKMRDFIDNDQIRAGKIKYLAFHPDRILDQAKISNFSPNWIKH